MKRPRTYLWLIAATTATIFIFATQAANSTSDLSTLPTTATTTTVSKRHQIQTSILPAESPALAGDDSKQETASGSKQPGGGGQMRLQHQRSQASAKQSRRRNNKQSTSTTKSIVRTKSPTSNHQTPMPVDPLALAQQQAKLMMGYNNTPPLFVTDTRDLFIDVAHHTLGITIKTIRALDLDGDQLEYSLQPANIHDASPYFTINSHTGELKLANRPFKFHADISPLAQARKPATTTSKSLVEQDEQEEREPDESADIDNDNDEDEEDNSGAGSGNSSSPSSTDLAGQHDANQRLVSRNLYFLNVAADDGRYTSVVELQIHVVNSSSFALPTGLPVQLTPEGSRKGLFDKQLSKLIQQKTEVFYNKLYNATASDPANSPNIVYPNFVNPGLVSATGVLASEIINATAGVPLANKQLRLDELASSTMISSPSPTMMPTSDLDNSNHLIAPSSQHVEHIPLSKNQLAQSTLDGQRLTNNVPLVTPQPMIVSLVVVCSCLMICLVLLMFIVPLSVKRLRKRLKNVELQHEHLSQKTSSNHGSSTVCSTSSTTSSTRNHMPSLSQFTLSSARSSATGASSVCRLSSLDSDMFAMPCPPIFDGQSSRINNTSVGNPAYLQQQQQPHYEQHHAAHQIRGPQIIHNQAFILHGSNSAQLAQPQIKANRCDNIYYPIDDDDDDYSTINTGSTILHTSNTGDTVTNKSSVAGVNAYLLAECVQPPPLDRSTESRNSDSDSSTRSLARFLSLPARHSPQVVKSKTTDDELGLACPVDQIFRQVTSKTIARASHIEREDQQHSNNKNRRFDWEIERHKLKNYVLLDAGQFGQVWRCNLRQNDGSDISVAVKMLKNSAAKDDRSREELLAEIEIMKLVCHHPHVVKILHCCTTNDSLLGNNLPILLIMEYVEMGNLQSYLKKSRISHNYATTQYNNNLATSDHLTSRDLMKFIYHVAKGMEYISSQWIVHRDLASRNILINSQRICKIGDFGMARHMQSSGGIYERHSRNTKIPVRWMAPEVLLHNRFTTKSDVYSFGILMWEIVTLGSTPYRELATEQVIEKVARNGVRPLKPEYCHTQLYNIMSKCWLHEPDERPTFRSLVRQFDELLLSANDYIELDQYPDHNYYNIPQTAAPNELL